ncbi:hypothetical protein [uncultured Pseudacidovorax sp.]|uniref:hypothetical protein n=1 Tax=uncultured Pseudacidovorax sp. TaxID=679313 RepID=UPI0025D85AD8|nr:hypothetical protein [uncultured Pseudacidovorax sp.]
MAAGTLFTVLANIPWGQVVENAPKVAEGAAKLWSSVTRRRQSAEQAEASEATTPPGRPLTEAEQLRQQVQRLEASVRDIEAQMQASTELIKSLAEQNTQLVAGIELNRRRLQRMKRGMTALAAVLAATLLFLFTR